LTKKSNKKNQLSLLESFSFLKISKFIKIVIVIVIVIVFIPEVVRFLALSRIKSHIPLPVSPTVNSFEFQPCDRTPQVDSFAFACPVSINESKARIIVEGVDYWGL